MSASSSSPVAPVRDAEARAPEASTRVDAEIPQLGHLLARALRERIAQGNAAPPLKQYPAEGVREMEQYFQQEEWQKAEGLANRWLNFSELNLFLRVVFYRFLANALFHQTKYDEAADAASRGIALRAGDYSNREQLATILMHCMQELQAAADNKTEK